MLRTFQSRALILCLILVAGLSVLSWRLIQIQLVERNRYAESAKKTYRRLEKLPALRGMIVDRNEEVVAKSFPVSSLMVDKDHLLDPKVVARGLAYEEASKQPGWAELDEDARRKRVNATRGEILRRDSEQAIVQKHLAYAISVLARPLGMRREDLRAAIENSRGKYFAIAKDLPGDVADRLREAIESSGVEGFDWQNSLKRWYPAPTMATHLIGFTGERQEKNDEGKPVPKMVGVFGVESTMESYLSGRDGWREHRRDVRGMLIPGDAGSLMPPRPGLNVQLTLDMGVQAIVEEEIDAAMKEYQGQKAAVVIMDPKTGGILAMASRPHFDLNRRERIAETGFNFALQAIYEPGSTFKIVSSSGALNENLVTPQTSIFCHNGMYEEGAVKVPDHHPYGSLTVEGVLQKSSNIGAYKLARQLGMDRFYQYVSRFGFGKKTGIQLLGESGGLVRNSGNPVDFSRASYGYAVSVTPLQVARAYCAIANSGELMRPRIVNALVANDGTEVERFPPEVLGRVMRPETAKKMRAALEKVVEKQGTAPLAAVPGYRVAGKTGTAKKHNPNGRGYLDGRYTVSFAGMMPADDPAFVAVVVIDDPLTTKVSRYGGTIAAPAFGKMAARIATAMNLKPTEPVPATARSTEAP
jgi:cell division protein FtsI/penicillin-binding protein 2